MTVRCQQDEVYAAENKAGGWGRDLTIDEARGYATDLVSESWFREQWGRVLDVEVNGRRARDGVGHWDEKTWVGQVELGPGVRNERTLLHEIAHVVAAAQHGSNAHDPAFVGIYLELCYRRRGVEVWTALREAMLANGVEW